MKLVAVIAGLTLGACPVPQANLTALDQDTKLGYGHAVAIPAEHLTLAFTALNEESRCPASVTCVAAGQARITVTVVKRHLAQEVRILTIPGRDGSDTANYMNYTITLKALDPYPATPGKPVRETYEATLVVSKT